ncbi:SDR family NAD(P)-dependent oxidoreductase [Candidatus Peregrinibacteria bacterium]|nr:SDR family NAD(P)-dependent oxidoreductase [Candidatus Peregrinibacteria bacterium]
MKILITGAAGFIGFHTAKLLLERGDTVVSFDNFNEYYDPNLKKARAKELEGYDNCTMIRGDIMDRPALAQAMKGVDRVCHLAALAGVRYAFDHPSEYIDINIKGFFHVIDEVRMQKIPGLIYASTSSVYGGNTDFPSKESDRVDNPLSLYGMNKRSNEEMAHVYHHLYRTRTTGLRFFTVYGPWGRPDMALFLFTDAIIKGEPLNIFGQGKMQRDFTYVDDIVSGIISAIDKNYEKEIFNLGCGKTEELMDYITTLEKALGTEGKKVYMPMQPGDTTKSSADISHAKEKLGFEPKTKIAEGIPKFVAWYKEYYGC